MSVWDAEHEDTTTKAVAHELENKNYDRILERDKRDRRENRPRAKSEELSSVIGFIQNAIERACLAEGDMFLYDAKLASNTLHKPIAGVTAILKNYERDVMRFAEKASRMEQYAGFDISKYSLSSGWRSRYISLLTKSVAETFNNSPFKTDDEKYDELERFLKTYGTQNHRGLNLIF